VIELQHTVGAEQQVRCSNIVLGLMEVGDGEGRLSGV
jgi:hypothetical protein